MMQHGDMLSAGISYHQHCPVCGRGLIINVRLLGRRVYCQHCGGGFVATDPASGPASKSADSRQKRVEELLRSAARRLDQDQPVGSSSVE